VSLFFENLIFGKKNNGEKYFRDWLLYSPTSGNRPIYCFCCKLFSSASQKSSFATDGFSDWSNAAKSIPVRFHEASDEHNTAMVAYAKRLSVRGRIDCQLQQKRQEESHYRRSVLLRVVEVIKFLAERGLAFRGDDRLIGSPNNGNFLGILELLSKFDPFLADHLSRFGNCGRGVPSYLSSTICDELIALMGSQVKARICEEIQQAKYYSISLDSTPDVSHTDQVTFTQCRIKPSGGPMPES